MDKTLPLKKKLLFALLAVSLSVALAAIMAEMLVRLLDPQQEPMRWFLSDPVYGYVNKPSFRQDFTYACNGFVMTVQTNSHGHRDPEYDPATLRDESVTRVLLIGDSFTFGYGVNRPDHFGTHLEQHLQAADVPCLVMNSGVGGWGTLQSVTYARNRFEELKPDVVVYTFCGSDYEDDIKFTTDMTLTDREKGIFYFPGKVFVRNHSHLYRFGAKKLRIFLHNLALKRKLRGLPEQDIQIDTQTATLIIKDQWPHILDRIREFHREFREFNADGIVIVQASAPWNDDIREHLSQLDNGRDLLYLDLYDDTIRLAKAERELPHDGHWSVFIQERSGERLKDLIMRRLPARDTN